MGRAELLGPGVSLSRPTLAGVLREPLAGPLAALVVACVVFFILTPQFATGYNISLILQQSMVIGILDVAQSLIGRGIYLYRYGVTPLSTQAPGSYKSLKTVLDGIQQCGLAEPVLRLRPLAILKG